LKRIRLARRRKGGGDFNKILYDEYKLFSLCRRCGTQHELVILKGIVAFCTKLGQKVVGRTEINISRMLSSKAFGQNGF